MAVTDALGRGPELGYWISSEEHPPDRLVDHAAAAEAAGFRTAMISDHFHPWTPGQGQSGFVWSVLGAIAARTAALRVGTGVTAPIARVHPVVIAHAAATVELLMPGRFFLGLGAGERINEQVVGRHWPTGRVRREMVEEAAGVIRRLWSGSTVTHEGEHFRVERARLYSRPDTVPPIVAAAGGRKSAQLAGRIADGLVGVAPDPDLVDAFEGSGGAGKPRLAQLHVCWAESETEARRTAHEWWPNAALPPALLGELAVPTQFAAAASLVTEDAVAEQVVCGPDPARHRAAIDRFVAAGFTTVYVHQIGPDQQGFLDFARRELLDHLSA
ncbi:MAG TPA: TIGR03557 family F420-dependent LLM class oxidoreductase [Acidimicrobiia bacterium]|jgi:G6PDH family F420-dependent oxidoreductase